jgi:cytochrome c5
MSAPRITALLGVALLIGAGMSALADPVAEPVAEPGAVAEDEARAGEGREIFIARCTSCHSVDYVAMHARFGTRALWEMEVAKMRNAFKAPLDDDEARTIVDYLAVAYAPPPAPPAASADDRQ